MIRGKLPPYLALRIGDIVKAKGFDGWVWMPDSLASYWASDPYIRTDLRELFVWDWRDNKLEKLNIPCYTTDTDGFDRTGLDVESVMSVLNGGPPIGQPKLLAAKDIVYTFSPAFSWVYRRFPNQTDQEWIGSVREKLRSVQRLTADQKRQIEKKLDKYEALLSKGGRRRRKTFRRSRKLKKTVRKIR